MKPQVTIVLLIAFLAAASVGTAQAPLCTSGTSYLDCPACGTAKSVRAQRENVLKNRDKAPESVKVLALDNILNPDLNNSFYPDMGAEVTGYVARVVRGGVRETCNCGRDDLRDIQIEIVSSFQEAANPRRSMIIEISPRWQKTLGLNDSNYELMLQKLSRQMQGRFVTFRGWLFYDSVHIDQSESTNPGNAMNWRGTPWEIHPVTWYKILQK
jgi:hypothetical protein